MEKGWIRLKSFDKVIDAELQKGFLEENGILAVVFNKKDSMDFIGDLELFVQESDAERARELLN